MEGLKQPELVRVLGERPVADPEVASRPERRVFSAAEKVRILKEADACNELGGIGAILRREGIYWSYLTAWRRERDVGALSAFSKARGPKKKRNPLADENERLLRENRHLKQRLDQAEMIIDVQKKVASMLGIRLNTPPSDGSDS